MEADHVFITIRPFLREIIEGVLQVEMKRQDSNSKLYEQIKSSVNLNARVFVKTSGTITFVC